MLGIRIPEYSALQISHGLNAVNFVVYIVTVTASTGKERYGRAGPVYARILAHKGSRQVLWDI